MIKISVTFPSGEGTTFDHRYYSVTHAPRCVSTWNPVKAAVEKGIGAPNVAGAHLYYETMEAFPASLGAVGTADVMADVANYTHIVPVMQVSDVVS